jgi:aspartyl-tRNA synthetase
MCGELRAEDAGQNVVLMGWVNRRRDHGGLIFLDLRDRSGITQVVVDEKVGGAHDKADAARSEYVVAVKGHVRRRGAGLENPNMLTGEIEVVADELLLLNESKTPPFSPAEEAIGNEEVRLKYRYLDLRRIEMQKNFALRSRVAMAIRNYLVHEGFLEIETPFMTRSTPEGARDYLVASRVHAGHFYALPQSPQIFKQILMISGFDKYFQIARCFRDEDLRADRQPEFTQIDLEMSFPTQDLVFRVVEGFLTAAFAAADVQLKTPFVRMTYDEAIKNYGIDKPDMRLPAMVNLSNVLTPELREKLRIEQTLPVLGFVVPGAGEMSGTARKNFLNETRAFFGDSGLDVLDVNRLSTSDDFNDLSIRIVEHLTEGLGEFVSTTAGSTHLTVVVTPKLGIKEQHRARTVAGILLHAPNWYSGPLETSIYKRVGALRLQLGAKFADKHGRFAKTGTEADFKFCWVTDFPMYEWNEEAKTWDAAHHPFTSPHEEDIQAGRLTSDKGAVRALAYDIVLNGTELGSGSIRIHRKDVQAEIFRSLGMTDEEAKERFGFFLDALEYGTPPHGGIALGLDRIVMILAGATSLREVIAFPKTAKAIDLMVDAPTEVSEQQLRELHLKIRGRS